MGQHLAAVVYQKYHHLVLQGRQVDFLVMDKNLALFKIHPEVVQFKLLVLPTDKGVLVPQPHTDTGQKLFCAEGFGHIIVRALVQGIDFFPLLPPGRDNNDRRIGLLPYLL